MKDITQDYINGIQNLLDTVKDSQSKQIYSVSMLLNEARVTGKTVFTMGNGGSATTASHFAQDLSKGTIADTKSRIKALCLADSVPSMLAWGNDSKFEDIFIEQLKNLMNPGDVIVGVSGSGNSMNIINAIEYANHNGGITVGISGYDGGKLLRTAAHNIHVPSFDMLMVEDIHLMLFHTIIRILRGL